MKFRSTRVRTKVVALLLSLFALWAFAATVTLREGLNLLTVSALADNLGKPAENLVAALQQERRLSLVALGGGTSDQRSALATQRAKTDEARATFVRQAKGDAVQSDASEALAARIDETVKRLDGLAGTRQTVDAGTTDRTRAAASYTDVIASAFRIYGSLSTLDDEDIAKQSRTLIALSRAREVYAQEDALLAGAAASQKFASGEPEQFVVLVGTQRFLYAEAAAELPAESRARYDQLINGQVMAGLRAMEDRIVERAKVGATPAVDAAAWKAATEQAFTDLRGFELATADSLVEDAKPAAIGVLIRLALAGGLGLIAVIASIVISVTTARTLAAQLQRLREAAWELATTRLPGVVERLRRGEEVDVGREAPPLPIGSDDEIGQLGRAFNAVQQTAIETAVEQAQLRQGVRDVFLSLARRTQALVHRQLRLLDVMERRENNNPEELADLFRVDHLATRMRRNAENLIVLSGATAGRGWRNPIPLVDVIRGALGEVEDYERVRVMPAGNAALAGRAVGDVIHLLAELIENATAYSPPDTAVHITGQRVANGFVVEVEDRGLGMKPEDLAAANERLKNPPEFKLTGSAHLGLYVVGRLATRHDIQVQLRDSPYGGTTAIVLIPGALVVDNLTGAPAPEQAPPAEEKVPRPGRAALRTMDTLPRPRAEAPVQAVPLQAIPVPQVPEPVAARHALTATSTATATTAAPERPSGPAEGADVALTPSGLPRRVRQASLAAPLRDQQASEPGPVPEPSTRRPEDIRAMIGSYQRATRKGRRDAEAADSAAGETSADQAAAAGSDEPQQA
ncbi:sensor histidine kinase [Longispora albida]|uniref:sensor histidine kinase n=1 Tax=Longispora albida TaxID=203523 RepID=UPI00036011A0|nr:nitrate- and nitrite sensing domain-containing protein [Longispora albida]